MHYKTAEKRNSAKVGEPRRGVTSKHTNRLAAVLQWLLNDQTGQTRERSASKTVKCVNAYGAL